MPFSQGHVFSFERLRVELPQLVHILNLYGSHVKQFDSSLQGMHYVTSFKSKENPSGQAHLLFTNYYYS